MADITVRYASAIRVTQLQYAQAVIEHGSFSQAAVALQVTQPALSNGIAALERTLGGPLFVRTSRGAIPTPLARRMAPHIDASLHAVHRLVEESALAAADTPVLRVGVSPLVRPEVIGRAFDATRVAGVALTLREDNVEGLQRALALATIDAAIAPSPIAAAHTRRVEVDRESLRYLAPAGGADAGPVEIAAVAAERQVLVVDACGLTRFVRALFGEVGATLARYDGEALSYANLTEWADLGLGGAIVPASRLDVGRGRPIVRDGAPVTLGYDALWLADGPQASEIAGVFEQMAAGLSS